MQLNRILKRAAVFYFGVFALMVILEPWLIFQSSSRSFHDVSKLGGETFGFAAADETRLRGVYFAVPKARYTLVYFGGNAETMGTSAGWLRDFAERMRANGMMFDYRGYGESEGSAHEAGLVADGIAAVQWLESRTGLASSEMIYLGRSLGGGVAIQVADVKQPRALVCVSTFSSLVDVAADRFWFMPVRWVMRNRFESARTLAGLDVPYLHIHGDEDRIVPLGLGQKLFEFAKHPHREFVVAKGRGHNDLVLDLWIARIQNFLIPLDAEEGSPSGRE